MSPKSARCSDKSRTCFTFKDEGSSNITPQQQQQQHQQQRKYSQRHGKQHEADKKQGTAVCMDDSLGKSQSHTAMMTTTTHEMQKYSGSHFQGERSNLTEMRKPKNDGVNAKERNRYSTGGSIISHKTSPKRERRRSPSSATSKVNSAPPTIKDSNFFDNASLSTRKQLSPTSQGQRKYSSSSSSGGSERYKEGILFPFDREALDYDRMHRECFALNENSSSSTTTSDTDEAENCSVYERPKCDSSNPADFYQQYTLLSQNEQHQKQLSRKNSKRLRSDSLAQKYIPKSDAFCPKSTSSSPTNVHHSPNSHIELRKFEDIASKFEQMAPKHGSIVNLATKPPSPNAALGNSNQLLKSYPNNNNNECLSPATTSPSNSRSSTPPLSNTRSGDFFMDKLTSVHSRKKSFKNKSSVAIPAIEEIESVAGITAVAHDYLDECQYSASPALSAANSSGLNAAANSGVGGGPINVTANPMEVTAVCTLPRATIVVQQVSIHSIHSIHPSRP